MPTHVASVSLDLRNSDSSGFKVERALMASSAACGRSAKARDHLSNRQAKMTSVTQGRLLLHGGPILSESPHSPLWKHSEWR